MSAMHQTSLHPVSGQPASHHATAASHPSADSRPGWILVDPDYLRSVWPASQHGHMPARKLWLREPDWPAMLVAAYARAAAFAARESIGSPTHLPAALAQWTDELEAWAALPPKTSALKAASGCGPLLPTHSCAQAGSGTEGVKS